MIEIKSTGEQVCETRKEFAEKYFNFVSSIQQYSQGNMGIVSVLSDLQHEVESHLPAGTKEHYRQILNDIKCILIKDDEMKEIA